MENCLRSILARLLPAAIIGCLWFYADLRSRGGSGPGYLWMQAENAELTETALRLPAVARRSRRPPAMQALADVGESSESRGSDGLTVR